MTGAGSVEGLEGLSVNRPHARGVKPETLHNPPPAAASRPGPKPSMARAALREMFSEWSDRTFATYWQAWQRLTFLGRDVHEEAIRLSTRPNGSLNVCKFARIAEARAAFYLAEMDQAP